MKRATFLNEELNSIKRQISIANGFQVMRQLLRYMQIFMMTY